MEINNKYLLRAREYRRGKAQVKEVKKLISSCRDYHYLTTGQKKEIQEFYLENYGKKIKTLWHEYCYSMNGIYSVEYVPHDLFFNKISYFLNDESMMAAYSNKNGYEKLFRESGVTQPVSILKNIHGLFYHNDKIITTEEAERLCSNLNRVMIKPTIGTGQGKNIRCFSSANGTTDCENLSVRKLFEKYGKNFILQEKVAQHPLLSSLNESSLNTFRVVTYRHFADVVVLGCALKIGKQGAVVDNGFAGGCFVGVDIKTGKLMKYLYSVQTGAKYEKTESGIVLDGFDIPFANDIFQAAVTMHQYLPYAGLVAWDISANDRNEAVLVEANINGIGAAIMQITSGPFFGKYTKHILNSIRPK